MDYGSFSGYPGVGVFGRGFCLLALAPFALAAARTVLSGVFAAAGCEETGSRFMSDMVLFFVASVLVFQALSSAGSVPAFLSEFFSPFWTLADILNRAGAF